MKKIKNLFSRLDTEPFLRLTGDAGNEGRLFFVGHISVARDCIVFSDQQGRPSAHPRCGSIRPHLWQRRHNTTGPHTAKLAVFPRSGSAMTVLGRCRSWRITRPTGDLGSQWIAPAFASPQKRSLAFIRHRTGQAFLAPAPMSLARLIGRQRENSTDTGYERRESRCFSRWKERL